MRYSILALVAFAIVLACNIGNKPNKLSGTDNLEMVAYTIRTDRDTTLETKNGALLKIPAGALVADNGNTVTLEIKEAYSLLQMIQGGLTTQSNGDPLSSGGMIYINAAAGQRVTFKQKIQVAIPADFLQKGMQLFKGDELADGRINWINPDSLPVNKQLAAIDQGRILFERNCTSCHTIGRDMTGPDLAHIMKIFPPGEENSRYYIPHSRKQEIVTTYIHNEYRVDSSSWSDAKTMIDRYYRPDLFLCNLRNTYTSAATYFSDIKEDDFISIYRYIQNESDRLSLPLSSLTYLKDCTDSCERYKKQVAYLKEKRTTAIKENGSLVERNNESVMTPQPSPVTPSQVDDNKVASPNYDDKVSPQNNESVYYQFTIESFGWYNIDILMKGIDGVEESELLVRITGQYREKINIYLIIPSLRAFIQGGRTLTEPDQYAFDKKNGSIPLPQNGKAYILAITESESSIAYSITEFTASKKQNITISLSPATNNEFNLAIKKLWLDSLAIRVTDSPNAAEIRQIDQQLKDAGKLKPANCNCDCIENSPAVINNQAEIMSMDK